MARARLVGSSSAAARLQAVRDHLRTGDRRLQETEGDSPPNEWLIVGSSRAAADELAAEIAVEQGGLFGVARAGFIELLTRLALPVLAKTGLSPTGGLGAEAVATRVAFEAGHHDHLTYFSPVAGMPGFPRAVARTLDELQQAGVAPGALDTLEDVGPDLATLLEKVQEEHARSATVTRAAVIRAAASALQTMRLPHLVLLDVAVGTRAERDALDALVKSAESVFATVPSGDLRTLSAWASLAEPVEPEPAEPAAPAEPGSNLQNLQKVLTPPLFSASNPTCFPRTCQRERNRMRALSCSPLLVKDARLWRWLDECSSKRGAAFASTRWPCCCARRRPT